MIIPEKIYKQIIKGQQFQFVHFAHMCMYMCVCKTIMIKGKEAISWRVEVHVRVYREGTLEVLERDSEERMCSVLYVVLNV